ncbi:MAG TPA: hypothetical protein VGO93_22950 [Candidatus Xenobia bacterium]|jgi:hypothetical protein
MPSEGNQAVEVRLPDAVMEEVKRRAAEQFPRSVGRGGGAAHWLRCLVYRELGLPEPEPAWAHVGINLARRQRRAAEAQARDKNAGVSRARKRK